LVALGHIQESVAMGDQAVSAADPAESKMGDAGKGSFQQSQNAAERQDEGWHDKLKDELGGKDAPMEGRKDAAGPGRGRS
jgi:hypothetical protein